MGEVKALARIGRTPARLVEIEFLVDTGTLYAYISPPLCDELGIDLVVPRRSIMADSRMLDVPMGIACIEVDGRDAPIIVGSLDVPLPLLGCEALEGLGFKVNPVDQVLEPARPFPETPILALQSNDP
jgi:predicted aspartyl protease